MAAPSLRGTLQPFMASLAGRGVSANDAQRQLARSFGKTYRRTDFLKDYAGYTGAKRVESVIKNIPKDKYIDMRNYQKMDGFQRRNYTYRTVIRFYDRNLGAYGQMPMNIGTNKVLPIWGIEEEAKAAFNEAGLDGYMDIETVMVVGARYRAGAIV